MKYYVYRHIRLDSQTPFYVGKGSGQRAFHLCNRNTYHKNIHIKHGILVEIVKYFDNEQDAYLFEALLIKLYRAYGYCEANLSDGGKGGTSGHAYERSEETRQKLSKSLSKYYETNDHIMKGQHISESHKLKTSEGLKSYYAENGHPMKGKTSKLKGTKQSQEHIKNRSNALKGRKSPMEGKSFSESHKTKISQSLRGKSKSKDHCDQLALSRSKGPFIVIDLESNNIIGTWNNQAQCARDLSIARTTISACLHGRMKSYKSYKFEYIT